MNSSLFVDDNVNDDDLMVLVLVLVVVLLLIVLVLVLLKVEIGSMNELTCSEKERSKRVVKSLILTDC